MQTKPARQFPDPLDGIQIGAVGRKVIQPEIGCLGISPGFVHFRMMVPGIVRDDHDALAWAPAPLPKELQEIPEALPVKSLRLSSYKRSAHHAGAPPQSRRRSFAWGGARGSGPYLPAVPTGGTGSRIAESEPRPMPIDQRPDRYSSLGVFFMLSLSGRLRPRNHRAGLHQPEPPLAKEPPTLACSQRHPVGPLEVGRQRLPVPQIAAQAEIGGAFSQRALDFRDLLRSQPARASTTRSLLQPGQTLRLEAVNPIFNGSRSVTQQFGNATAVHPLCDHQYAVQPVVIARFRTSSNLILQTQNDDRRLRNRQRFHALHESTSHKYSQLFMTARIARKIPWDSTETRFPASSDGDIEPRQSRNQQYRL